MIEFFLYDVTANDFCHMGHYMCRLTVTLGGLTQANTHGANHRFLEPIGARDD